MRQNLVIIYQFGKVGSTTIAETLRHNGLDFEVQHAHFLSSENSVLFKDFNRRRGIDHEYANQAFEKSKEIRDEIRRSRLLSRQGIGVPKIKIITGVREIVSLILSNLFQNRTLVFGGEGQVDASYVSSLICQAVDDSHSNLADWTSLLINEFYPHWFDREIKAMTSIDLLKEPFDVKKGYAMYKRDVFDILVIRQENFEFLNSALCEFLGTQTLTIYERNSSERKRYKNNYRVVKNELRLPVQIAERLMNFSYMRHFYSDLERRNFVARWTSDG